MGYFDGKAALKVFYYFIAVDGEVTTDELGKFEEIGREIDPEKFDEYKNDLIAECEKNIAEISGDDEYLDILREKIDTAINSSAEKDKIPTRLVIWDLLMMAYSDNKYDDNDKKMLKHICRVTDIDVDLLQDMEFQYKAYQDVSKELDWVKNSNKPYGEAKEQIDELEGRLNVIQNNITAIIADEAVLDILCDQKRAEARKVSIEEAKKAKAEADEKARAKEEKKAAAAEKAKEREDKFTTAAGNILAASQGFLGKFKKK